MKSKAQIFIYFFLIIISAKAQIQFQSKQLNVGKLKNYKIESKDEITAVNLRFDETQRLTKAFVETEDGKYFLQRHDEYSDTPTSQLVIFDRPIKSFTVFSGELEGNIRVNMQYVKPLKTEFLPLRQKADSCEKPAMIPISEWRKGLPAPKEAPAQSKVNFVIVHHAAGSNTAVNFTEVVRNIYVFHTSPAPNGNGWNDVGYNFLIAQDGTIYEGRDGQGKMEGDNVIGAHFCGKNTNTMGICLLGNYMEIEPPKAAINSLVKLIGWKLSKESLQNIGQAQHSGGTLNIISGHRDGCSTDCPGNFTYAKLNEIRQAIGQSCTFKNRIVSIENPNNQGFMVYPNPSSDYLQVDFDGNISESTKLEIYDLNGKELFFKKEKLENHQILINISDFVEGVYFLRINEKRIKFVVSH